MKKQTHKTQILIAVLALFFALTLQSLAADGVQTSGQCGDNVYWSFDESTGELVISGEGDMWDYFEEITDPETGETTFTPLAPWQEENVLHVVIEDGVTSVGDSAFRACEELVTVSLGKDISAIGNCSFGHCSSLANIILPAALTSIDDEAFFCDDMLASITIPNNVETIGEYAFSNCFELAEINLGSSVKRIENCAFESCKMTEIFIPESVDSIGDMVFGFCDNLKQIIVADNNQYYCNDDYGVLFNKDQTSLIRCPAGIQIEKYEVPDSVTSIMLEAFGSCTNLKEVVIPESVRSIGGSAFYNCNSLLTIELPVSLEYLAEGAISVCENLVNVNIKGDLKNIECYTFGNCYQLKNIVLPPNVETIGDAAFVNCNSMVYVCIGSKVKTIEEYAFYDCTSLTDIYYSGTEEQWNAITIGENNEPLVNATVHYESDGPAAEIEVDWEFAKDTLTVTGPGDLAGGEFAVFPWDEYAESTNVIIMKDIGRVGENVFSQFTNLTTLIIDGESTVIESGTFDVCPSMDTVIVFGDTEIQEEAFVGVTQPLKFYREESATVNADTVTFHFSEEKAYVDGEVSLTYDELISLMVSLYYGVHQGYSSNFTAVHFDKLTAEDFTICQFVDEETPLAEPLTTISNADLFFIMEYDTDLYSAISVNELFTIIGSSEPEDFEGIVFCPATPKEKDKNFFEVIVSFFKSIFQTITNIIGRLMKMFGGSSKG